MHRHYTNDGRLAHIIKGQDAPTVYSTILRMGLVSQMDHASYLGCELAKGEPECITYESLPALRDCLHGGKSPACLAQENRGRITRK